MLTFRERVITACLNGGFLSVVTAWHSAIFDKLVVFDWETLMLIASGFWLVAAAAMLWYKSSTILQMEIKGRPPAYYLFLAVPFCIYASIAPWALLEALSMIIPLPS